MEKPKKQKKPIYRRWWFWFLAVFIALAIIGSISGGNETANNPQSETTQPTETPEASAPPSETPIETEIPTATPEPVPSETVQPTPTPTASHETSEATPSATLSLASTELFEDVYVPYALGERALVFYGATVYAENCGYEYTVNAAEYKDEHDYLSEIKIYDGNDYVYLAFIPNDDGIEMLMTVSYYQASSNSEVSLFNGQFRAHVIGEQGETVESVDDQRAFLFG